MGNHLFRRFRFGQNQNRNEDFNSSHVAGPMYSEVRTIRLYYRNYRYTSTGDKSLGGDLATSVGQFIHAVDAQLQAGNIDIAVHSTKDVPVTTSEEFATLAFIEEGANDLLIFPLLMNTALGDLFNSSLESSIDQALQVIPHSGMVGTVSAVDNHSCLVSDQTLFQSCALAG